MRRRQILGVGTVGALAGALGVPVPAEAEPQPTGETWTFVACPGCDRPVAFLPAQKRNRCAHCKTAVSRGLV